MLGPAHFESFPHVNSRAPTSFYANGIERPGIKRLRKVLTKHESRFSEQEESAQLRSAERSDLHIAGEHVAGEGIARIVDSTRNSSVRPAKVGINFIVWGREVELPISPEHIVRKKHTVHARGRSSMLGRNLLRRQAARHRQTYNDPQRLLHEASTTDLIESLVTTGPPI